MLKKQVHALLLVTAILTGVTYVSSQRAYAHSFSGDESASFLTLIEATKVQLQLAQSDFGSNMEEAQEHAEHAAEGFEDAIDEISEKNERLARDLPAALEDLNESLSNSTKPEIDSRIQNINDLLAETIIVRIDQDQLSNSTAQALVLANMADEVLGHYGEAYGSVETETNATINDTSMEMGENASNTIVDMVQYHSAQAMAAKLQQYYNETVKALAPSNATEALAAYESGLEKLKQAIDNKKPLDDVQVIVHGEVHPNLQSAFNLRLIPEFPLPLLLLIPTIAGIIAVTRIRMPNGHKQV